MTVIKKYSGNQRGLALVELLIAAAIGLMVLAASIYVFTFQQSLLKDENDSTKVRAKGRLAIKILAREIRMAGFGLPPGGAMTDIATPNSISFRTNKSFDGSEAITRISLTAGGIDETATSLTVADGTDFLDDDKIVVYQTGWFRSRDFRVDGNGAANAIDIKAMDGTASTFGSPAFEFGLNANLITVNKFNDWTIALSGDEIRKTVDGGNTVVLIDELKPSPGGLQFDYAGIVAATTSKIGITLNLLDPDNDDAAIEFKTDVTLRNLGIKG